MDDEDRENEGDLILAADFVSADAINFMARFGRGLICLTIDEARARQLDLQPMVRNNGTKHGTNFTVSIEAAHGVSTGISAADRAQTIRAAVAADAKPADIVQPGHVFPLIAQRGGVLVRAGHTEAGCDLCQLAGLTPAAVICEILRDDGTMARLPDLVEFAARHQLKIGTIADLIHYRSANESLVERLFERSVDTRHGPMQLIGYRDKPSDEPHLALVRGGIARDEETLVRVHQPVSVLDLIDTAHGSRSWSIDEALRAIAHAPAGVLVLLNCAQPANRLFEQMTGQIASSAERGGRRSERRMDYRTYGIGAQILRDLGVGRMRLLAAPRKMPSMAGFDLEIVGFQARES